MKTESITYIEFKKLISHTKLQSDPIFCRLFLRPLSFPVGWLFYKSGIRANTISLLSIFFTSCSSLLICFGQREELILAAFIMLLVGLMDCIDGNVARARKETGPSGEWMDAFSGYTVYALLPISLGIYLQSNNQSETFPEIWIKIGAITSISNLYLRLIYQKYVNSVQDKIVNNEFKGEGSLFSKLSSEMGLVGFMMPTFLLCSLVNLLEIFLIFYCLFYSISVVVVAFVLLTKVN
ncbi:MAG: hypothetical protein CMM96_00430 [Rickettsiales bacterium]|nr:hypothetical protein [Rickettsiales bacterium]|tara:strand:+ start:1956 stop:2666 length:711 start_codon:yes stop_codon:yes gene_type:complete